MPGKINPSKLGVSSSRSVNKNDDILIIIPLKKVAQQMVCTLV
jgi:hypothetical protein